MSTYTIGTCTLPLIRTARRLVPALAVAAVALGAQIPAAHAASTINLTTTADELSDNGKCSLREAIQAANTNKAIGGCPAGSDGEDTIKLGTGTYKLTRLHQDSAADTTGDWNITSDLVIQGAGSGKTVIDADHKDRVFFSDTNHFTLNGVTLKNGRTRNAYDNGGAIYLKHGMLMTSDVVVTTSDASSGGAIFVDRDAYLLLTTSTISYNDAVEGGGVYNRGTTTIENSVVKGNDTRPESPTDSNGDSGGGVYNIGDLTLNQTTVEANSAEYGGGVYNSGQEFTAFIYKTTISNNSANDGGGVVNSSGLMRIEDSTISGNRAKNNGGGINNNDTSCFPGCPGVVYVNSTTIANNRSNSDYKGTGDGGGIYNASYDNGNRVRFSNTILGKNYDGGNQTPGCAGSISSYGYNIVASTKGCTIRNTNTGNKLNVDPKIGSLANNGGRTKTHALNSGSPAIDAASEEDDPQYGCFDTDQRGVSRRQDGNGDGKARCDIGSYERSASGKQSTDIQDEAPVPSTPPLRLDATVETIISDTGASQ